MKKRICFAAAAAVLLIFAAVLLIGRKTVPAAPTQPQTTVSAATEAESTAPATTQAPETSEAMQETETEVHETEVPETEAPGTEAPETEVPGTEAPETTQKPELSEEPETMGAVETRAPQVQTDPPHVEPPAPTETESPWLEFPIVIPEYELEIQAVRSYDGIYLEDGSDTPISGVAALLVTNRSDKSIDLAKLQLTGEQTDYAFTVTGLASGATAVVMEEGKAPAVEQRYRAVSAEAAQTDSFEMSEGILSVEEDGDGLKVTNLTDRDIPCVRIFYKFYLEDVEAYVGGITYTVKLPDLKAGASMTVQPSHYAVGSSRVIMAKTYDTDLE